MESAGSRLLRRLVWILIGVIILGIVCYAGLMITAMWNSSDQIRGESSVMIVLGCRIREDRPTNILKDRLDKALEYLEDHEEMTVIVSGGQRKDEPRTEASAMAEYLTEGGVDPDRILVEDRSVNTLENLVNTRQMMLDLGYDIDGNILVVSSGFHLTRVKMIWQRVYGSTDNLSLLSAPTSQLPSAVRGILREPIGLIKSFLFDWPAS
ncbi:MAG: YdcF family protein [Oscillospiraceae bacterium]|nr:YdcF family protein [Oscillospiraceae bacterium]